MSCVALFVRGNKLTKNALHKLLACIISGAICLACLPCCLGQGQAFADEADTKVAQSAQAYNEALENQKKIANDISTLNARIQTITKELPKQQALCNESLCAMYKNSTDNMTIVSALLNAQSITDVLAMVDAYNWIYEYNENAVQKTIALKKDLEDSKTKLVESKKQADEAASTAANNLEAAKQARKEAQQKAAEAQKKENEAAAKTASSSGKKKTSSTKKAEQAASSTNVNWNSDKQAFVKKWAPRINAYLKGSPTAGTGTYYAQYAWDYGVDPRWAPAISFVESSKGAACFRSHNAWGYGSSGYVSWQEGIKAICSALGGSMYGGYLTKQAAKTYCPPSWESWYNKCAREMAKI